MILNNNNSTIKAQDNDKDESSDTQEMIIDDPYDSASENLKGIPAVLAMQSQMLNDNILQSFFPA